MTLVYYAQVSLTTMLFLSIIINTERVIRVITFALYLAHMDPIFKIFNILPLNKLIFSRIGIMMYTYSKGLLPEVIGEM